MIIACKRFFSHLKNPFKGSKTSDVSWGECVVANSQDCSIDHKLLLTVQPVIYAIRPWFKIEAFVGHYIEIKMRLELLMGSVWCNRQPTDIFVAQTAKGQVSRDDQRCLFSLISWFYYSCFKLIRAGSVNCLFKRISFFSSLLFHSLVARSIYSIKLTLSKFSRWAISTHFDFLFTSFIINILQT